LWFFSAPPFECITFKWIITVSIEFHIFSQNNIIFPFFQRHANFMVL
jgi:hypothetical protein